MTCDCRTALRAGLPGACALLLACSLPACGEEARMGPWPVPAVAMPVPKARCEACHGAGLPPAWAFDASTVIGVEVRRAVSGTRPPGAEQITRFSASGEASREVFVFGEPPPGGVGSFGAERDTRSHAVLPTDAFDDLKRTAAASGLFRVDGEAATSFATHGEGVVITVDRAGAPDTVLLSANVLDEHATFQQVLAALDAVAARLEWQPVDEAARRAADDRAVYEAVLREPKLRGYNDLGNAVGRLVVFSDSSTEKARFDWLERVAADPASAPAWLAEKLPGLDPTCLADFARVNLEPGPLPDLVADVPVEKADPGAAEVFFQPGSRGPYFWDMFPDATGWMDLSRVGYDDRRQQALVYIDSTQGGLAGAGYLVLLVRLSEGWVIQRSYMVWIS